MDQGFTFPTKAPRTHAPARAPHAKGPVENPELRSGAAGARAMRGTTAGEERALHTAEKVRFFANIPINLMLLPGFAAGILGGGAKLLRRQRSTAVLKGTSKALMETTRQTPMNDLFQLPSNMAGAYAAQAEEVGGRAQKWVQPMTERSRAWGEAGVRMRASVGNFLEKIGMKAPIKAMMSGRLGRLPVAAWFAGIGAISTAGVIWMTRSAQSRAGKRALADMTQQLGADNELVAKAKVIRPKEETGTIISSALSSAGEAAFVVLESNPAWGMPMVMAGMSAQMFLPQVGELFVPENEMLNAYVGFQQTESSQRAFYISQLINGLHQVNQFNKPGHGRNNGAIAMANLLVTEHASNEEVIATLREPEKFEALTKRVAEKQQTAEAAKHPAEHAHAHAHAPAHTPAEAPAPHIAAGPQAKIAASETVNEGRVHEPFMLQQQPKAPDPHASHASRLEHAAAESAQQGGRHS